MKRGDDVLDISKSLQVLNWLPSGGFYFSYGKSKDGHCHFQKWDGFDGESLFIYLHKVLLKNNKLNCQSLLKAYVLKQRYVYGRWLFTFSKNYVLVTEDIKKQNKTFITAMFCHLFCPMKF